MENNNTFMYTEEQLMARLKFFIGICLALTLTGIVFVVLFSIIFVTQPLNAISPIDSKFFELIIPIATFLTGTLSGIMLAGNDKDLRAKALDSANRPYTPPPAPPAPPSTPKQSDPVFNSTPATFGGGFNTPVADTTAPQVVTGFGGKPAPAPAPQPLI